MDNNFFTMFGSIGEGMTPVQKLGITFLFLGKLMMPATIILSVKVGSDAGFIGLSTYMSLIVASFCCGLYGMYVEPCLDTEKRINKLEKKLEKLKAA
tara:strand:+ start:818 stop:1108 length:291 start_codon:yes stop_codon:yes gene_type:complete